MQSKNVLWLGALFITLLTVFCIAKYINKFNPDIQTISSPNKEIIDQNFELKPVQITDISETNETQEVDENYLNVIKLVEQEEKDIEDAYNKSLIKEKQKNLQTKKVKKPIQKRVVRKKQHQIKRKIFRKKPKKILIETLLSDQTLLGFGKLSRDEKQKLKKIVNNFKKSPSSYLKIEIDKINKKFYKTKKYLVNLGIPKENIEILHKTNSNIVSNSKKIEITISLLKRIK